MKKYSEILWDKNINCEHKENYDKLVSYEAELRIYKLFKDHYSHSRNVTDHLYTRIEQIEKELEQLAQQLELK